MKFEEFLARHNVPNVYDKWRITCVTRNRLLGGWPKNPDTALAMLQARVNRGCIDPSVLEEYEAQLAAQNTADGEGVIQEAIERAATGFLTDAHGLYIEGRQLVAGFREVATTLGFTGTWGWRNVLQHGFGIRTDSRSTGIFDHVYFQRDGKQVQEPEGVHQMIAHVMTAQGPRNTIKFHDYLEPGVKFCFEVWRAAGKAGQDMPEKEIAAMLAALQENGLGCSRSQGFGRFDIEEIDKFAEGVLKTVYTEKKKGKTKKAEADE